MTDTLKPCPFCGGPAEIKEISNVPGSDDGAGYSVGCLSPGLGGLDACLGDRDRTTFDRRGDAIASWNRRSSGDYQKRVVAWMERALGLDWCDDRLHRFLEEALELAQAVGCSKDAAKALLDRVFERESGFVRKEVGDVMVTLAGLSEATCGNLADDAELGLVRAMANTDTIRAKRDRRQPGSPLPGEDA